MKRAFIVLSLYLLVGAAMYFAATNFPNDSGAHQWLNILGILGMGVPCILLIGLGFILPHEFGHIFVGQRLGFRLGFLRVLGFSWFCHSGKDKWDWDFEFFPPTWRVLFKKNPTVQEIRMVLVAGPISSLIMAALFSPFLFFESTKAFGMIAAGGNLLYAFGSILGSDQDPTDGRLFRQSFKDPEKSVKMVKKHYDDLAAWLRPSGYELAPYEETADPKNNCAQHLYWYWKLMDAGKVLESEPHIHAALQIAAENPIVHDSIVQCCYEAAVFYRRFVPNPALALLADRLCIELDPDNDKAILVKAAKLWTEGDKAEANRLWEEYGKGYSLSHSDLGSQVHGRDWFIRLRTEDMVFETNRLYARPWALDDVESAFDIYRKPEVNQYLGRNPKSLETIEEARAMLERWVANQAKRPVGQGTWALVRKDDEKIIGTIMCKDLPNGELEPSGEIEIGWHLDPEAWGYGYATEAGLAVAEYGFKKDPNLSRVLAVVYPENNASKKVASKVGMTHLGISSDYYGMELDLFELKRPE